MAQTIRIRMMEKEVEFDLNDNMITESSLTSAFLLAKDAVVSLAYEVEGRKKFCRVSEACVDGKAFVLPKDWSALEFFMESDKVPSRPASSIGRSLDEHHQKRSESPRIFDERLAVELRNRLYFIPRAQKAYQDPEEPSQEANENEINGGCVSPISPRAAVTYAHRTNRKLRVYDEKKNSEENVRGIVEIRQCDNPSIQHSMKVIVIDSHHDFVILYSTVDRDIFDDYPFSCRPPRNFEWFLGFGLSYKNHGGQQVTHRSGRICSVIADYRGQMLASASIDGGDSGGPCYSEDRSLIGIMVSSTTTDPSLGQEYDCDTMEEELRDASCSPADTWIAPGNLMMEAFRMWQVQQGIIKVRREREPGGPKAKRSAIDTS